MVDFNVFKVKLWCSVFTLVCINRSSVSVLRTDETVEM